MVWATDAALKTSVTLTRTVFGPTVVNGACTVWLVAVFVSNVPLPSRSHSYLAMPLSSVEPAADRVLALPTVMSCGAAAIFATGARWIFRVFVAVSNLLPLSRTRTLTTKSPGWV